MIQLLNSIHQTFVFNIFFHSQDLDLLRVSKMEFCYISVKSRIIS